MLKYKNPGVDCRSNKNSLEIQGGGDKEVKIQWWIYSTIRLRARDFYEVIVDEGEGRINYHCIEIESE